MPRVKPKRHNVIVDMTPFVDVAFLILTFFILTAQFRSSDLEDIVTPKSISSLTLEETDMMTVNITEDGRYSFSPIESSSGKKQLLEKMAKKYNISFTEGEINSFVVSPTVPVPMSQLKSFLHVPKDEQANVKTDGIPLDEDHQEVMDWIKYSLEVNPSARLSIKGDAKAQYPKFQELFEQLRNISFYKFNLITTAK